MLVKGYTYWAAGRILGSRTGLLAPPPGHFSSAHNCSCRARGESAVCDDSCCRARGESAVCDDNDGVTQTQPWSGLVPDTGLAPYAALHEPRPACLDYRGSGPLASSFVAHDTAML